MKTGLLVVYGSLCLIAVVKAQNAECIAKNCWRESGECVLNTKCRKALECLGGKCAPPCEHKNATECDTSQCIVTDGKCSPGPKCTLRCFDVNTQYNNAPFNNFIECMYSHNCKSMASSQGS